MIALLVAAALMMASAEYVATDDVKILTTENFDETIKNNEFVLVEFYGE